MDASNEINLLQIQLKQTQSLNDHLEKENKRLKKNVIKNRSKSALSSKLEFSQSTKSIVKKSKKRKITKRGSKFCSRSLMLLPNDKASIKSAKEFRRSKKLNKSMISNNSDIQNIFQGHDLSADKIYGDVIAGPGEQAIYQTQPIRRNSSMPPRSPSPIFGRKKAASPSKKVKIDKTTL